VANAGNIVHVPFPGVAGAMDFREWGLDVAEVGDPVAEGGQLVGQSGNAEGGRSHVGAPAVPAEVERGADDVDGFA
jgi:hypothetical protein